MRTALVVLAAAVVSSAAALAPAPDAWPARSGVRAAEATALEQVALGSHEGSTVVDLRTSGAAAYQASLIDAPPRIVVDLPDTAYAWRSSPLRGAGDPVKEVRGSQPKPGAARVVIELARISDYRVAASREGLRVIIEGPAVALPDPGPPSAASPAPPRPLLHGVVRGQRGWVAYLQDSPGDSLSGYRVGDSVGAHIVETIDAERVVLRGPEGRVELRVDPDTPGARLRRQR